MVTIGFYLASWDVNVIMKYLILNAVSFLLDKKIVVNNTILNMFNA